jgi:hypothetical protein
MFTAELREVSPAAAAHVSAVLAAAALGLVREKALFKPKH